MIGNSWSNSIGDKTMDMEDRMAVRGIRTIRKMLSMKSRLNAAQCHYHHYALIQAIAQVMNAIFRVFVNDVTRMFRI